MFRRLYVVFRNSDLCTEAQIRISKLRLRVYSEMPMVNSEMPMVYSEMPMLYSEMVILFEIVHSEMSISEDAIWLDHPRAFPGKQSFSMCQNGR